MNVLEDPVVESMPLTDRVEFRIKEEHQIPMDSLVHQTEYAQRIDDQKRQNEYLEDLHYGHYFMAARRNGLIKD